MGTFKDLQKRLHELEDELADLRAEPFTRDYPLPGAGGPGLRVRATDEGLAIEASAYGEVQGSIAMTAAGLYAEALPQCVHCGGGVVDDETSWLGADGAAACPARGGGQPHCVEHDPRDGACNGCSLAGAAHGGGAPAGEDVVIVIRGGIVRSVQRGGRDVPAVVMDYDTRGADPGDLLLDPDGGAYTERSV